jgi:Galactose oxidase, central domain
MKRQMFFATSLVLLALCSGRVQAGELSKIPVNKWTQLPGGAVNGYANPMYDPATKTMVILQGNGTAHLDAKTGKWTTALAPAGGSRAGDQPLMKRYSLKNGRPSVRGMLLYHMTAWDSKRKRLVAGGTGFMASYDTAAKKWTDLGAKVELSGKKYAGVPPVAWGSMCYDPVNDQIVMLSGGAVYNFDNWEKHKEATGALGTYIFDPKTKLWTRPQVGPKSFYAARDLIRPVRFALQDEMSKSGEAIVLERNGKDAEAKKLVAAQTDALKKLSAALTKLSADISALGKHKRLASGATKIAGAAKALKTAGSPEEVYRAQFAAYKLLISARDEDLWSHAHPRCLSPMVYLPEEKQILLFGGTDGYQLLNDTWAYDCTKREWKKRSPKTLPRPRQMHVMVYDSKLKKAVLAGGYSSSWAAAKNQLREVWTYDFKADDWKLVVKDFPFMRGAASYFGEYHAGLGAIIMIRSGRGPVATFALKLAPGGALSAPKTDAYPKPEDKAPFIPPKDDPKVLARWKSMPANTWVPADPPWEPGGRGWGMTGFNGRMNCAVLWGGGHSTHQANDIQLYFPGANRWITGYPAHRINIAPWNKGCGNPGGVDFRGGVYNLHARRGLGGNGTRALINIQCFSPYFYGPEAFMKQPARWGKTTTFEFDFFSRRWRLPCPQAGASGMCYPYNAKNTVMAVSVSGAQYYDREKNTWTWASKSKCPGKPSGGEGASNLYIEKKNMVVVVGPTGKNKPVETWALDIKTGVWKNLKPAGAPPGRPSALTYCEKDDALFAGCFTGFGKKPLQGQEAVYSFKKNQWITFPSKQQKRVLKRGQRYKPTTISGYHNAWSKIAFSPKHNLILRHNEGRGMWVMRPEFGKLEWGK